MSLFTPIFGALTIIGAPILLYLFYNVGLAFLGFKDYERYEKAEHKNRFAAVIAARNESGVIGQLIDTLMKVDYPRELLDIWVIPNNCDDNTADVARIHGAKIYEPKGAIHSKGEALSEFFDYILKTKDEYDAFCVFDADNLVTPEFFTSMNDALEAGEKIAQGYRDSKNPGDSWISGCQSMFYWITNRFLNRAKRRIGLSAVLNGTGFMVSSDILKEMGFNTKTMTEDIEFSVQCILKGYRIAFIADAITYDEHPTDFDTSWKQRKRWSTGIIQTCYSYSEELFKRFRETKKWIYIDMILYLIAPYFQVLSAIYSLATLFIYGLISFYLTYAISSFSFAVFINFFGFVGCIISTLFIVRFEKHQLHECPKKSYFAFWWFLYSWTLINVEVFFNPITTWEPIEHTKGLTLNEIQSVAIRQ